MKKIVSNVAYCIITSYHFIIIILQYYILLQLVTVAKVMLLADPIMPSTWVQLQMFLHKM